MPFFFSFSLSHFFFLPPVLDKTRIFMGYEITNRGSITTLYYQHPPNPISKTLPNGMKFNVLLRSSSTVLRLYRPGLDLAVFIGVSYVN